MEKTVDLVRDIFVLSRDRESVGKERRGGLIIGELRSRHTELSSSGKALE